MVIRSLVICGPHSNTVENVEGPACGIDPVSNILRNGAFLENGALWVLLSMQLVAEGKSDTRFII